MHRRQYLRAVAAVVGAGGAGVAAAHEDPADPPETPNGTTAPGTATGTPTSTPTAAVATPTSGWDPLARLPVEGATEVVLDPDGKTAFLAVGDGFATVDLADPASPSLLTREAPVSPPGTDRLMQEVWDVKYDAGELLVAGPASYHPDAYRGVIRYDVTDPAAPELLDAYETTFPIHNCDYADGVAYLTGRRTEGNPLVAVDVESGTELARWSVLDHDDAWSDVDRNLRNLHDVWVQDGYAYLAYWDAGTWILDVSDPANPAYVANVTDRPIAELANDVGLKVFREFTEPPGNDHYAATNPDGTLLAIGQESWNSNAGLEGTPAPDDPGGPSGIELYDVSDKASPEPLATIDPPPTADANVNGVWTTAHNFEVGDRYLYAAWYQGGVSVHDLADPANPRRVRYFRRSSRTSFWTAQLNAPGGAVVATSRADPSDPEAPARLYTFPDVARETPTPTGTPTRTPTPAPVTEPPTPAGPTQTATRAPVGDTETSGDGPGFGPLAAVTALGIGAWHLLGDGDEE